MTHWKIEGADATLNGSVLYSNKPVCVLNAFPPARDVNNSSILGIRYLSTLAALLIVTLKSPQIHTQPLPFSTGTIGTVQSENWTGWIMLSFCRRSNLSSTFLRRTKGMCLPGGTWAELQGLHESWPSPPVLFQVHLWRLHYAFLCRLRILVQFIDCWTLKGTWSLYCSPLFLHPSWVRAFIGALSLCLLSQLPKPFLGLSPGEVRLL